MKSKNITLGEPILLLFGCKVNSDPDFFRSLITYCAAGIGLGLVTFLGIRGTVDNLSAIQS